MMSDPTPFKQCSLCAATWQVYQDFVTDPELQVEGYQACFDDPDEGLILVTHRVKGCGTTLALRAKVFKRLYGGPWWPERRTGLADCLRLCLDKGRLEECTAECALAWVRQAIKCLRRHELPAHLKSET